MKKEPENFIANIVEEDLTEGYEIGELKFRFPPEPNGYLHIGHAKSIFINFSLGRKFNAPVFLRFDDTNPLREEKEFVLSIEKDIKWLGFHWSKETFASNYFQQLYDWAVELIKNGYAYVDSQPSAIMAEQKGSPTSPGINSPFRTRTVQENLELFCKMKNGEVLEGSHVLRAKINMAAENMLMRDPVMYRMLKNNHHRTGSTWKIYPMYDWAHGQCDFIEKISHSFATLEFNPHRELYNWFLDKIPGIEGVRKPKQREFPRLNLSHTVLSKRKLAQLIENGVVASWDDPRMPTISGMRRRGYTPAAIQNFIKEIGVTKREGVAEISLLEFFVREDLNKIAPRVMAVLNPVKLVITNYLVEKEEDLQIHSGSDTGVPFLTGKTPFSREIYIEEKDFQEIPSRKFYGLAPGREVRLKGGYIIRAEGVVKDSQDKILEVYCTYDPLSRSGSGTPESNRKVKGTLHWVSVKHAVPAEVRLYEHLFTSTSPYTDNDFTTSINPESLRVINAFVEPAVREVQSGEHLQFLRTGYFVVDKESRRDNLIFNRTVSLREGSGYQKKN
jgi:glutaminyl-tRNA synthetase